MSRINQIRVSHIITGIVAVFAGLLLASGPASAASNWYIQIDDIKGPAIREDSDLGRLISTYNELVEQIDIEMVQLASLKGDVDELEARAQEGESAAFEYEKASAKLQQFASNILAELVHAKDLLGQIAEAAQGANGSSSSRRRGEVILEDLTLAAQLEQAVPAIEEAVTIVGDIGTE